MNYLTYLTQMLVNHAVHELMNSEKTIEEIAADSGFPNSHAFTRAFQSEYGMKPSAYRRMHRNERNRESAAVIEHSDYLASLRQYLYPEKNAAAEEAGGMNDNPLPALSCTADLVSDAEGEPLMHTWKQMISIGKASDILLGEIQQVLRRIQREIGFQYLFFNGIFSDDMHICTLSSKGEPVFLAAIYFIVLEKSGDGSMIFNHGTVP